MSGIGPEQLNINKLSKIVALQSDIQGDKLVERLSELSTVQKEDAGLNGGNGLSEYEYLIQKSAMDSISNPTSIDSIHPININGTEYIMLNKGSEIEFYSFIENRIDTTFTLEGSIPNPESSEYSSVFFDDETQTLFLSSKNTNYLGTFDPWTAENNDGVNTHIIDYLDPVAKNLTAESVKTPIVPVSSLNNVGHIRIIKDIAGAAGDGFVKLSGDAFPFSNPIDVSLLDANYNENGYFGSSIATTKLSSGLNALMIGKPGLDANTDGKIIYHEYSDDFSSFSHPGIILPPDDNPVSYFGKKIALSKDGTKLAVSGKEGVSHYVYIYEIKNSIYVDGQWNYINKIPLYTENPDMVWMDNFLICSDYLANSTDGRILKISKNVNLFIWEIEFSYDGSIENDRFGKSIVGNSKLIIINSDSNLYFIEKFIDNIVPKKLRASGSLSKLFATETKIGYYESNIHDVILYNRTNTIDEVINFLIDSTVVPTEETLNKVPDNIIDSQIKESTTHILQEDLIYSSNSVIESNEEYTAIGMPDLKKVVIYKTEDFIYNKLDNPYLTISEDNIAYFGRNIAISGDNIAITGREFAGVYSIISGNLIFEMDGTLLPSSSVTHTVSLSSSKYTTKYFVVGSPYSSTDGYINNGSVFIYETSNGYADVIGPAIRSGDQTGQSFGSSIAVYSTSNLLIGSKNYDNGDGINRGKIDKFQGSGANSWDNPTSKYGNIAGGLFGSYIRIYDSSIYVYEDINSGSVYVFDIIFDLKNTYVDTSGLSESHFGKEFLKYNDYMIFKGDYNYHIFFKDNYIFSIEREDGVSFDNNGFILILDHLFFLNRKIGVDTINYKADSLLVRNHNFKSNFYLEKFSKIMKDQINEHETHISNLPTTILDITTEKVRDVSVGHNSTSFGNSMDSYSNYIIFGAKNADLHETSNTGAAYLYRFTKDKNGLPERELLHTFDDLTDSGDRFGEQVAISSNFIFVSSKEANTNFFTNNGCIYVYNRSDYSIVDILSGPGNNDYLGTVMKANDDYIVAYGAGSLYIYKYDSGGDTWGSPFVINSIGHPTDIAIQSNKIYVGQGDLTNISSNDGYVLIYEDLSNNNTWTLDTTLYGSGGVDDLYGCGVAVNNNYLFITEMGEKKIYMYDRVSLKLVDIVSGLDHSTNDPTNVSLICTDNILIIQHGSSFENKLSTFKIFNNSLIESMKNISIEDNFSINVDSSSYEMCLISDNDLYLNSCNIAAGSTSSYVYFLKLDNLPQLAERLNELDKKIGGVNLLTNILTSGTNGVLNTIQIPASASFLFAKCVYEDVNGFTSQAIELNPTVSGFTVTLNPVLDVPANYENKTVRITIAYTE